MLDAAVDDVRARDAVAHRVERRADLRQHAAVNRAVGEKRVDLARGEPGQQVAVLVEHADRVRHQHELLGKQRFGELAGDEVGVDVVGLAVAAHADRRDHRDEVARIEQLDDFRVDAVDLADEPDVDHLAVDGLALQQHLPRVDERAVLPGEADRLAALLVDEADDLLVELAQHHLDDVHHPVVGDAHPLPEFALDAHLLQQVADLRAAAVDDHRIHPDELQHDDVAREARLERRLGHRVAAVLDDDDLVVKALDVRQRLGKDLRLEGGVDGVEGHGGRSRNEPRRWAPKGRATIVPERRTPRNRVRAMARRACVGRQVSPDWSDAATPHAFLFCYRSLPCRISTARASRPH